MLQPWMIAEDVLTLSTYKLIILNSQYLDITTYKIT